MEQIIKIVLDVSPILQGQLSNNNRTGVYQVNKNILLQLENNKLADVYIYCKPQLFSVLNESELSKYIKKNKVINWNIWQLKISEFRSLLYKRKQLMKDRANKISWFVYALIVELMDKTILSIKYRIKKLNSVDVFFSAYEQLPDSVLKCNSIVKALYIHDVTMILYPELYRNIKSNPITKIVKTINSGQILFANSYNTKKDFLKVRPDIHSDRIKVVYPGCNLEFAEVNNKSFKDIAVQYKIKKTRYVFTLCSIAPNKNILRIVRSFLEFVKKYYINDICLVLGGALDGEYGTKMLNKLRSLDGFSQYVNYIGYVSDEDLPVLYKNAEWFVFTSKYEGFGTPPLEAMRCECPVIVSDSSSLPEVVGEAGLLIPWNNDEAHVEAYRKYYFDDMLRKQNGLLGKERANMITWEKAVEFILLTVQKEIKDKKGKNLL